MSFKQQVIDYWRAGYPGLYVLTSEETRVEVEVKAAVDEVSKDPTLKADFKGSLPRLYYWRETQGWYTTNAKGESVAIEVPQVKGDLGEPRNALKAAVHFPEWTVCLLLDFHRFFENGTIQRQVRDLTRLYKGTLGRTLIFCSPRLILPPELVASLTLVEFRLPTRDELATVLDSVVAENDLTPPTAEIRLRLAEAGAGQTTVEFENAVALAWRRHGGFPSEAVATIFAEKAQVVKKSGALECILKSGESLDDVGGFDLFKDFVKRRAKAFLDKARKFGLRMPKGVLFVGPPGVGKSLSAKAVATMLQLPLLRLDAGALFGSYVGQSELNTREALAVAEAMAPVVLWIDEIERGIGIASAQGVTDSGVLARVVATILTWLQEKTASVYVVATANEIAKIPPALMRAGRFDAIFYCDLPAIGERMDILRIHLRKKKRDSLKWVTDAALRKLAQEAEGYSGAEIAEAVEEGLLYAFEAERELKPEDISAAFAQIVPLSKTASEALEETREWAKKRARPSSVEASIVVPSAKRRVT